MPLVTVAVQIAVAGVADWASKNAIVPDVGTTLPLGAPKNVGVTVELKTVGVLTLGLPGEGGRIFAVVPEGLTICFAFPAVPTVKLASPV